jgi:hypothetical protein
MKKISTLILSLFIGSFVLAQTIVSTTPEKKNAVLEEFTGIHCGYCPSGHAIAKSIKDAHPDDVTLINIHTGAYANPNNGEPNFKTAFGNAIANQSGLTGYPSGTVNRHVFSGSNTAMGRGSWENAVNTIIGQTSYVNVALEAEIDVQTRIVTIHVEAYYTGDSPQTTNKLNVALMQNYTLGPQSGGGMGDEYVHMHRLVHLVTGQWGEDITTTTQGSFIDKTYTYTIPADYKGVTAVLQDLEIAAFVAEGKQEIISGISVEPSFTNLSNDNNVSLEEVQIAEKICGNIVSPIIKIRNHGNNTLTSADIAFNVAGNTDSVYHWTGTLGSLKFTEIELGAYEFTPEQTNNLNVEIISIGGSMDEDPLDNTKTGSFKKAAENNSQVTLTLNTDQYATETSWKLYNSTGKLIDSGRGYDNNSTITKKFDLELDCYKFMIFDSFGDGTRGYNLKDSEGIIIHSSNGRFGKGETVPFEVIKKSTVGIETVARLSSVNIYPNPACDILTVNFELEKPDDVEIKIYDIEGSFIKIQSYGTVNTGKKNFEISVADLKSGMYYLVIETGGKAAKKKISIVR